MEPKQAIHYNFCCCCYYVHIIVMIKKLELHLLVVIILLRLNLGMPKLVFPKLIHQCQKQPVSTPVNILELNFNFMKKNISLKIANVACASCIQNPCFILKIFLIKSSHISIYIFFSFIISLTKFA